jgi:hypothetical protein
MHTSAADPSCHFDEDPDFDAICHFDADPDPTFHFDSDPDANPGFQVKAQNLERCSSTLLFHTFWLVICKLMRIQKRIQLITFRRIRILHLNLMRIHTDPRIRIRNTDAHYGLVVSSPTPLNLSVFFIDAFVIL